MGDTRSSLRNPYRRLRSATRTRSRCRRRSIGPTLLHTIRSAAAIAELWVADSVQINRPVPQRYLHGEYGAITGLDDHSVAVRYSVRLLSGRQSDLSKAWAIPSLRPSK